MGAIRELDRATLLWHRFPCWWLGLAQASGILLAYLQAAWWVVLFVWLISALLARTCKTLARGLLACGVLLTGGWLSYAYRTGIHQENDLRLVVGNRPLLVRLEGRILKPPTVRLWESPTGPEFGTTLELGAVTLHLDSGAKEVSGRVCLRVDAEPSPEIVSGARIEIFGVLQRPQGSRFPGDFDARRFLALKGIHYEVRLNDWTSDFHLLALPKTTGLADRFRTWAMKTLARGQPASDRAVGLIWAMVLGWRTWLTGESKQWFMESGTLHVFAISGLHVAVIASLLVLATRCFGFNRRFSGMVVAPMLWLYTLATGYPPSAIRAATLASIVLLGWMLRRPPETLNSLGATMLIVLLWDPLQLLQPGFQLSFGVVLGLTLLPGRMLELTTATSARDPLALEDEPPRYLKAIRRFVSWVWHSVSISLAAWLSALPLSAYYFGLLSPVGIVANLAMVPLASLTVASACLSLFVSPWFPSIGVIANSSAWFWMSVLVKLGELFARVPLGHVTVPQPSVTLCVLYYAILFYSALAESRRRILIVGSMGLLLFIGELVFQRWANGRETKITLLPVPAGDAIFVDLPGRHEDHLIDGGPEWSGEFILMRFLADRSPGKDSLRVILSHGDKEHVAALGTLLDAGFDATTVISGVRYRSTFYRDLLDRLRGLDASPTQVLAGEEIWGWSVIHPTPDASRTRADQNPLVLSRKIFGLKLLLLSDLEPLSQRILLDQDPRLEADIVFLNVPPTRERANEYILHQLNPQLIVVSGSSLPLGNRWVEDLARSFSGDHPRILFTGKEGAIEITFTQAGTVVRTSLGTTIPLTGGG